MINCIIYRYHIGVLVVIFGTSTLAGMWVCRKVPTYTDSENNRGTVYAEGGGLVRGLCPM